MRPTRIACSNERFASSLALHQSDKRLDVLVGHRPAKGAAHEAAQDALGIGQRLLRDDLHAVELVRCRRRRLRQVAEDAAVACRRPGVVERAFDFHPLDRQPRSVVSVGPDLVDGLSRRQPVGEDADGIRRLQSIDELDGPPACRPGRRSSRQGDSSGPSAWSRHRPERRPVCRRFARRKRRFGFGTGPLGAGRIATG